MSRLFGYSRVSTSDLDWALRVDALSKAGVDDRDIFREKQSGAKAERQELRRVLDLLRSGDKLVVSLMDRIDAGTATSRMLFGIFAVLAEFERNLISERSKAGQAIARAATRRSVRPNGHRADPGPSSSRAHGVPVPPVD
ncbi:recombinase family protein [Defluviicoccus vanus]|uniref:recombinase family protein n=1 Tax=Defluviicoccus vanus TaxID=111831 RepID=UPI001CBA623D|nr:recombinase family protein [Defluviicoccus vanus]